MPSTKFPLHPTYCSGADNNWRLSRWPPWQSTWIRFWWRCLKREKLQTDIRMRDGPWSIDHSISSRWSNNRRSSKMLLRQPSRIVKNVFSNSESPCYPNASHQVLSQSDLPLGSRWGLKIFKMATLGAISDIGPEQFQQSWISMSLRCR